MKLAMVIDPNADFFIRLWDTSRAQAEPRSLDPGLQPGSLGLGSVVL